MQVFHKLDEIPATFGPTLVSVGNFDGVHRAHRRVLSNIVERAKALGCKSIAVTFEPHPIRILRPDSGLRLIAPTAEKIRLLAETEIDRLNHNRKKMRAHTIESDGYSSPAVADDIDSPRRSTTEGVF